MTVDTEIIKKLLIDQISSKMMERKHSIYGRKWC